MAQRMRPYQGEETYIFVSYSHRDSEQVHQIIGQMMDMGYRLWYDEGIEPGTDWDDNIANHVRSCDCFLAFVSENYIRSENCKDELNYARDLMKDRLLVYLEEVDLPAGMAMRMNRLQAIYRNRFGQEEAFYRKLEETSSIARSLSREPAAELPEQETVNTEPLAEAEEAAAEPAAVAEVASAVEKDPEPAPEPEPAPAAEPAPAVDPEPAPVPEPQEETPKEFGASDALDLLRLYPKRPIDTLRIPRGFAIIRPWALKGFRVKTLIIPDSVTELSERCLAGLVITERLVIPSGVKRICPDAFCLTRNAFVECGPDSAAYRYCRSMRIRNSVDLARHEEPAHLPVRPPVTFGEEIISRRTDSYYNRGIRCINDTGDYEKAFREYLLPAAQFGHDAARFEVALCYLQGLGVGKSEEEAMKWLFPAAYAGVMEAQMQLGKCFETGTGVPMSLYTAAVWYRAAGVDLQTQNALKRIAAKLGISNEELARLAKEQCLG